MRNIKLFMLAALLMVGMISTVRAENSATAFDDKYWSQQVFVSAYNDSPTLNRDSVVILNASSTAGSTLGGHVIATQVSDSIFIFGVTDESISAGSLGRICVRGAHKVAMNSSAGQVTGQIIGSSTTFGKASWYSTADGTAGGQLGYLINATATSDTGDATNTYWAWITPRIHK